MAGLSLEDLIQVAARSVGPGVRIRDLGLLSAALARVATRVHGRELYPSAEEQAAALLHSLVTTVPLEEGNRRFAWAATAVFLARRGQPCTLDDASVVALVTDVVTGRLESVGAIAARLG